jgi:hypothetical protein
MHSKLSEPTLVKEAFSNKKRLTSGNSNEILGRRTKVLHIGYNTVFYNDVTWELRKVDDNYL